jgi:hypothetical protein
MELALAVSRRNTESMLNEYSAMFGLSSNTYVVHTSLMCCDGLNSNM